MLMKSERERERLAATAHVLTADNTATMADGQGAPALGSAELTGDVIDALTAAMVRADVQLPAFVDSISSLAFHPTNPHLLLVSSWDRVRRA